MPLTELTKITGPGIKTDTKSENDEPGKKSLPPLFN